MNPTDRGAAVPAATSPLDGVDEVPARRVRVHCGTGYRASNAAESGDEIDDSEENAA